MSAVGFMLRSESIPTTCRRLRNGLMDPSRPRFKTISVESVQAPGSVLHEGCWWRCHQGHVALTSMMWSSVAGTTRTWHAWLWLNTCPGLKGSSRGMATPFCCWSPLPTEWTLPRLRMLAVSPWSSSVLSSRDRLSFSTQLSESAKEGTNYWLSKWQKRRRRKAFCTGTLFLRSGDELLTSQRIK